MLCKEIFLFIFDMELEADMSSQEELVVKTSNLGPDLVLNLVLIHYSVLHFLEAASYFCVFKFWFGNRK